jgi:hypothetical protein
MRQIESIEERLDKRERRTSKERNKDEHKYRGRTNKSQNIIKILP